VKFQHKILAVLLLALSCALPSHSQGISAPGIAPLGQIGCSGGGGSHRIGAIFYAPCYATWQGYVLQGFTGTGSQSMVIVSSSNNGAGGMLLADGSSIPLATIFTTNMKMTVSDANSETVTPTAVTVGSCGPGFLGVGSSGTCATVTASFSNAHGAGALVYSGDSGIFEAITDAGNLGGGLIYWAVDTGIVALNTGGLTTTTTTFVPSNFISAGASARVTTTITTTTNWAVGITGSTSAFCTANATLTAGTTCLANMNSPASVGTTQALTALLITTTVANPGAGAVKSRVWGWSAIQASQ